ncbi:DDE-type integrase/transposase/recombinase [Nostoc sp.]|uniref:DDE-type integrase/transposase/recombinase n=1 Tax=Nostoc sp. TaxID=1180 RepID=UPI002FFA3F9C
MTTYQFQLHLNFLLSLLPLHLPLLQRKFFHKALKADHNITPRVINVDKNAAYPPSINELKKSQLLPDDCELQRVKYLNNHVEQDHRFIKRLVKPGMGFTTFNTARRTLRGYEAMNMIRKGQVKGVEKTDIAAQVKFVAQIFGIVA